jgi:hypothetical protein
MVTVQFSKRKELVLPESLGHALGLCEGDRVEVQRQGSILWFWRRTRERSPGPLTDLTRIVSSSRPVGSVDVDSYMDRCRGRSQSSWRSP